MEIHSVHVRLGSANQPNILSAGYYINLGSIGVYQYRSKLVFSGQKTLICDTFIFNYSLAVLMEESPQVLNKTKEQNKLPKTKSRTKSKKKGAKLTTTVTELR